MIVAAYVGGYVALRTTGRLSAFTVRFGGAGNAANGLIWICETAPDGVPVLGSKSWWILPYRPVIAVEQRWRNR